MLVTCDLLLRTAKFPNQSGCYLPAPFSTIQNYLTLFISSYTFPNGVSKPVRPSTPLPNNSFICPIYRSIDLPPLHLHRPARRQ